MPPERAETLALYADTVHGALSTDPAVREKQREKEKKLQFALDLFELGVIDREELLLRMQTK